MAVTSQSVVALTATGNVTIDSGCKQARLFLRGYRDAGNLALSASSLNGVAGTVGVTAAQPNGGTGGIWIRYWDNPSSGTIAISWTWSAAPDEGPVIFLQCITADGTISVIDSDAENSSTGTSSVTSTSTTGDYAAALAVRFAGAPSIPGGATSLATTSNNSEFGNLYTVTAGNPSTTATAGGGDDNSVALIVVRDSGGGGGGAFGPRRTLMGVGRRALPRGEWQRREDSRIYTRRAA